MLSFCPQSCPPRAFFSLVNQMIYLPPLFIEHAYTCGSQVPRNCDLALLPPGTRNRDENVPGMTRVEVPLSFLLVHLEYVRRILPIRRLQFGLRDLF